MRIKLLFFLLLLTTLTLVSYGQATTTKAITVEEYDKAKNFKVADLDKDTYVKFDNTYVLDRYEMRKPYFITGDDGLKKRIDIYHLIAKTGMQQLGTMIFYTNEKGMLYNALVPSFASDGKVWEKYFEDIHAIDKKEANFVLKLSYILSKEFSFQASKAANGGKELQVEGATYGTEICFPGTDAVTMADGSVKLLQDVKEGDKVVTVDPQTNTSHTITVKNLVAHEAKNYALTQLTLVKDETTISKKGIEVLLHTKIVEATPNHPVITNKGQKNIGSVTEGEFMNCLHTATNTYEAYKIILKKEYAGGVQKVYNMDVEGGKTFIMNNVIMLQKGLSQN